MLMSTLRDWQALLPAVRTALENRQSKLDEWDRVQQVETTLTTQLRVALVGTGHVLPSSTETLPTLIALADDSERQLKQLETAIERATGAEITQSRQARQWAGRDVVLLALQKATAASLQSALAELLLSEDAGDEVARARLVEFEQLNELNTQLLAAQTSKTRAEQALAHIANAANTIWESLGDAPATDLRTYSEQVAARLDDAEQAQAERTMAQQAADAALRSLSGHEATARRHSDAIARLCQAASVETANQLPEAEESSTRKREAQESVDKTRRQLSFTTPAAACAAPSRNSILRRSSGPWLFRRWAPSIRYSRPPNA
jgi:DNA repair protein SbcC/Rad50